MVRDEALRVLPSGSKEGIMSEKLKPCPFCGGEAEPKSSVDTFGHEGFFYVLCRKCYARTDHYETGAEVIEAWNRRANEEEER